MAGDYFLDFSKKFTKLLPENIKLDDILTKDELANTKIKEQLQSIFNVLADSNGDGELDANEINELIRYFDNSNDNKLSQKEIDSTSKLNKFNAKYVKLFLERIHGQLNNINKSVVGEDGSNFVNDCDFVMNEIKYSNNYIVYDSTASGKNRQAFFDMENDALLNSQCDKQVQITGIKAFQEKLEKMELGSFPKLVIQNSDGTTSEIEIKFNVRSFKNDVHPKDSCMHYLTFLINNIADLPPEVLNDLTKNVKEIVFDNRRDTRAWLQPENTHNHNYNEIIALNPNSYNGTIDTAVLIHEIGHAVDSNLYGYMTEKDKDPLESFIIKMKDSTGKNYYALKNPQEFYAEYYAYKHTTGDARESNKLFRLLDESLNNGDPYGWKEIKEILENVKPNSEKITADYQKQVKAFEEKRLTADNQKDAIALERINNLPNDELYKALCKYNSRTLLENIEEIIKSNLELKNSYYLASDAKRIDIIKTIRNFPEIKKDFEQFLTNYENKIKQQKEELNNPFDNATLSKVRAKTREDLKNYGATALSFSRLYKPENKDKLAELLKSPELRELIDRACNYYGIRKSNAPITKEVLQAFQNEIYIRNFLINTKSWIN